MEKSYRSWSHSDTVVRHAARIEDSFNDPDLRAERRFKFLKELAVDSLYTGLLNLGTVQFDTMSIFYDYAQSRWVCELFAEEMVQK